MYFKRGFKFFVMLIFFILLFNQFNFAKIYGVINGTVIAEDTGEPLSGVIIKVFSNYGVLIRSTKTNSDGYYIIKNLNPETYAITLEAPYDSSYCSLPYYYTNNLILEDPRMEETAKEFDLLVKINSGEIKEINKRLKKGTKVEVNVNLINNNEGYQWRSLLRMKRKKRQSERRYILIESGLRIVLPVGEQSIIEGIFDGRDEDGKNIFISGIKREVEVLDTNIQTIIIDYDLSNCLEVNVIKPASYNGRPPGVIIYEFDENLNREGNKVADFDNFTCKIYGLTPKKYVMYAFMGIDYIKKKFKYNKILHFYLDPGISKITVDFEE